MKKPVKAYKDIDFLTSADGRTIRLLAEYLEPQSRFRKAKVKDTIVFYGSARIPSRKDALAKVKKLKKRKKVNEAELDAALTNLEMSRYYEDTVNLSRMLTKWSMGIDEIHRFVICSGGGPGIMEASNKGAKLAGGKSIGLNISLPFEQEPNPYITDALNFEFHYFFMRKFWFAYLAKALIIMPGGFGTMDELFELLTLVQTGKIKKKMPIVVYDKKFWEDVFNFKELGKKRLVDPEDLKLFHIAESVEDAFNFVKSNLEKHYLNIEESLFNVKGKK
jgi:uncharacterized protein (TIGR00730 family)